MHITLPQLAGLSALGRSGQLPARRILQLNNEAGYKKALRVEACHALRRVFGVLRLQLGSVKRQTQLPKAASSRF